MREIKFKCLTECSDEKEDMGFPKTKWVNFNLNFGKHIFPEYKQISPDLQFTGLKDNKGVDIYEGDIVTRKETGCEGSYISKYIVIYKDNYFGLKILQSHIFKKGAIIKNMEECEVIGNIHENQNLLNNE